MIIATVVTCVLPSKRVCLTPLKSRALGSYGSQRRHQSEGSADTMFSKMVTKIARERGVYFRSGRNRLPVPIGQDDWCFVESAHVLEGLLVLCGWSSGSLKIVVPGSEQTFRILDRPDRSDVALHLESKGLAGIRAANLGFVAVLETQRTLVSVQIQTDKGRAECALPKPNAPDAGVKSLLERAGLLSANRRGSSLIAGEADARHPDAWAIDATFDAEFYRAGFPQDAQPADPASHYLSVGWQQGRLPTPWFSNVHYLAMHRDVADAGMNPFLHFCVAGKREGRRLPILGKAADSTVYAAHAFAVAPGPHFEEFDPTIGVGRRKRAKVLAFYLPQFHPVTVNDEQWGAGFTEWRQLPRGMPRFEGHIQPRIPRDLGTYSLAEGDAMRRQIEMAAAAGLFGFCFYHYWFDGKRVLETPMERFLADPTLDFPFCLMWANENWTRTWDGSEKEVILAQTYREEEDIAFVDDLARHMKDPRYIRLHGRPLFFIYRPGYIPNTNETTARWRDLFRDRHGIDPLFFQAQAFGDNDPRIFDFDGAIEFPPHKILSYAPDVKHEMPMLDGGFTGDVREYESVVASAMRDTAVDFPLIRTVFPSWDNDARRPGRGTIVAHSTPHAFSDWFEWAVQQAESFPVFGENIVCVNAWNEWAEGAYLEPDVHFGSAYLNELSRVLHGVKRHISLDKPMKVLLVGHDLLAFGAQKLLVNIGETLSLRFGVEVGFLIMNSETHAGAFTTVTETIKKIGPVIMADQFSDSDAGLIEFLKKRGYALSITNTTPAGKTVSALKTAGIRVLSLIHELPTFLKALNLTAEAKAIALHSDVVIYPSKIVQDGFETFAGTVAQQSDILPQGLYNTDVLHMDVGDHGLRAELGLGASTKIVLGVGYADLRKGIDRFVSTGLSMAEADPDIAFLWVGAPAGETIQWFQPEIDATGLGDRVRILGYRDDVARFFAAADAFYLSSREDPFPSVVLEALAVGLPVVGHRGCGGCDALIETHGFLVAQNDPMAAAQALRRAIDTPDADAALARRGEIAGNYDFGAYVFGLVQRLKPDIASVSAVIPNYNYEAYIGERLRSVFDQTHPLREVIVLDDASPDNSLAEIERTSKAARRTIDLVVSDSNSGSPFVQWRNGVRRAKGDYVWIAEADDLADPTFVDRVVAKMQRAGSVLGFADSRQIDGAGTALGDSYRPYIDQIEPGVFDHAFDMAGPEFLARFLSVKNVILNVSGVIFHRQTLLEAFDALGDDLFAYRVAGDWRLYAEICNRTDSVVTWLPNVLNTHRRHAISVTHTLQTEQHLAEIGTMHALAGRLVALDEKTRSLQADHLEACRLHLMAEQARKKE